MIPASVRARAEELYRQNARNYGACLESHARSVAVCEYIACLLAFCPECGDGRPHRYRCSRIADKYGHTDFNTTKALAKWAIFGDAPSAGENDGSDGCTS